MRRRTILAWVAVAAACADPSGPSTHEHPQRLLIAGTEDGAVVVDLDWRGIIRRSGPRFVVEGPSAIDSRGDLITVGRLESGETVMAAIDLESGLERWRTAISQGVTPNVVDGVELGAARIAANPSRTEVFLWRAGLNGVIGIAGYDYARGRVTRFLGPMPSTFRGMAGTPATAAHPQGCLVLALDAAAGNDRRAFLHRVCGADYEERDSVAIALPSRRVIQMETTPDGRDLVLMTDAELLKLDAATLLVRSRAARPLAAPFHLARATGSLIIPDAGSDLVASTGLVFVLDAGLELSAIVDLRVLPFGERPLGILGAEESRDGRWLYVVGGVSRNGPPYGPEETHVLVVDKTNGAVTADVRLATFGGGRPVLVP